MLDDLLALTTTLVHSDHEHELSAASGSETDIMAPRSRHTKSASVASSTDADTTVKGTDLINGGMLPPATTPDHTTTRTSKRRPSRSTTSPPSSPVVVIPATRKVVIQPEVHKDFEVVKFVGTVILSTLLEAGLQTAASMVGTGDYAAISKRADTWPEILGLLAWKIAKLGIYWAADFDGTISHHLCLLSPMTDSISLRRGIHDPAPLHASIYSSRSVLRHPPDNTRINDAILHPGKLSSLSAPSPSLSVSQPERSAKGYSTQSSHPY